ncbi:Rho GTPase activating protein [Elasticomyces elasticus]|nr:Rho GTPase activating protein [Elasticomyces elasticus]
MTDKPTTSRSLASQSSHPSLAWSSSTRNSSNVSEVSTATTASQGSGRPRALDASAPKGFRRTKDTQGSTGLRSSGQAVSSQPPASGQNTGHNNTDAPSQKESAVDLHGVLPNEVHELITSAGSGNAAVQKLLNDKNQAASHNAQLWMLVEKQRAMILGLNKDLEKALIEKERYRAKLNLRLQETASASAVVNTLDETLWKRDTSEERNEGRDEAIDAASAVQTSAIASSGLSSCVQSIGTVPTTVEGRTDYENIKEVPSLEQPADKNDDERSILTDAREIGNRISQDDRKDLAIRFADELIDSLESSNVTNDSLVALPEILLEYSKLLDLKATKGVEKKASTFVRHHRKNIVRYARDRLHHDAQKSQPNVEKMDISSWAANISCNEAEVADQPLDVADVPEIGAERQLGDDLIADIGIAQAFLFMGTEFRWLLDQMRLSSTMIETGSEHLWLHKALAALQLGKPGRYIAEVAWNPITFLDFQYRDTPDATITTSITYSGADGLIEAVGCKEYINRVWPMFGDHVLSCIEQLTLDRFAHEPTIQAVLGTDNATLELSIRNDKLLADIEFVFTEVSPDLVDPASHEPDLSLESTMSIPLASSHCWTQLVRNPVIVKGYPVARRYEGEQGLEIDIGLMVTLARACRATIFDSALVLQGLFSMLVAVKETAASVVWHYLLGQGPGRLCYSEARRYCDGATATGFVGLQHARHFVGWTRSANVLTGTATASYEVGYAGDLTEAGCVLENVTIGVSKIIALSAKLSIGSKDMRHPMPISEDYRQRILQLEMIRVVFYDTSEKRAWMVNGADALLHLCRAYLSSPHAAPARHRISEGLIRRFTHRDVSRQQTAYEVLCDPRNRSIPVCPGPHFRRSSSETSLGMRFENIVVDFGELLWEMRGHQQKIQMAQKGSVTVQKWPSTAKLEGFGFADIVSMQPLLQPRFAELDFFGPSWLKVTDQAGSINIIGSGFGDLMASVSDCTKCTEVPPGHNLLATSTELLRLIAQYTGGDRPHCLKLAKGIFWNHPEDAYGSMESSLCHCDRSSHGLRCGVAGTSLDSADAPAPRAWEYEQATRFASPHPHAAVILGDKESWKKARREMLAADRPCLGCRLRSRETRHIFDSQPSAHDDSVVQTSSTGSSGKTADVDSGYASAGLSQKPSLSADSTGVSNASGRTSTFGGAASGTYTPISGRSLATPRLHSSVLQPRSTGRCNASSAAMNSGGMWSLPLVHHGTKFGATTTSGHGGPNTPTNEEQANQCHRPQALSFTQDRIATPVTTTALWSPKTHTIESAALSGGGSSIVRSSKGRTVPTWSEHYDGARPAHFSPPGGLERRHSNLASSTSDFDNVDKTVSNVVTRLRRSTRTVADANKESEGYH